jgi:hypothetical protein
MQFRYHDRILKKIGARIARDIGDGLSEQKQWQFKNFLRNLADQRRETTTSFRPWRRWVWASAAVSVLLCLGVVVWIMPQRTQELPFWVGSDQSTGRAGELVEAPDGETKAVRFPSGSEIILENGAKATVVSATEQQVQFRLDSGYITADIKGNGTRRWSIEAGLCKVVVLGTRFSVSWNRNTKLLDVKVERGTVLVLGTKLDNRAIEVKVTKGTHLRIDQRTGFVVRNDFNSIDYDPTEMGLVRSSHNGGPNPIDDDVAVVATKTSGIEEKRDAKQSVTEETALQDEISKNRPVIETPAPKKGDKAATRHSKRKTRSNAPFGNQGIDDQTGDTEQDELDLSHGADKWRLQIENGEYEQVIQHADVSKLDILMDTVSIDALWELMHAARRLGEDETAIDLLLTCRRRFFGRQKAAWSAYYLAKIYDEKLGNQREALMWFNTYLDEAPSGELSQEAEGRIMIILDQLGRDDYAKENAKRYLRRYPRGSFEKAARSIVND